MSESYDNFYVLAKSRRSIRQFLDKPVEDEILEKLVEVARWAPSASNRQGYRFLAIKNPGTKEAMADAVKTKLVEIQKDLQEKHQEAAREYMTNFSWFNQAPVVLVPIYRQGMNLLKAIGKTNTQIPDSSDDEALASVAAATMNLLLAAEALGLGTCWMTGPLLAKDSLAKLLKVPQGWAIAALIPLGYPAEKPTPPKRRTLGQLLYNLD
jgi:nitroreductase